MCKIEKSVKTECNNEIIFDPPIKPRYLPNEVPRQALIIDLAQYRKHRYRVANAKPKIDDKAPVVDLNVYYDLNKLLIIARRAKIICQENLQLVRKMNKVFRVGTKVDCWLEPNMKFDTDQSKLIRVHKEIEETNRAIYNRLSKLKCIESELSPQYMARKWKEVEELIKKYSKFPLFKNIPRYPSISYNATMPTKNENVFRTKCFFDLVQGDSNTDMGRIVFELYEDFVPTICENFKAFCQGYNGLSYRGTTFYRIVTEFFCLGGDVTKFNGTGGASIYESTVEENYSLQHTCPGVLSAALGENNKIDSKFILTFRPLSTMDGNKIVFGKIIRGIDVLFKIEALGTKYGEPLKKIIVSHCGLLQTKKSSSRSTNRSTNESKK